MLPLAASVNVSASRCGVTAATVSAGLGAAASAAGAGLSSPAEARRLSANSVAASTAAAAPAMRTVERFMGRGPESGAVAAVRGLGAAARPKSRGKGLRRECAAGNRAL